LCRSPVGGVGELAARSEWCFAAAIFLSGGGSLWSSAVDLLPYPRLQVIRAAVCVLPSPESEERRIRVLLKLLKVFKRRCTTALVTRGVSSPEPVKFDYPAAEGVLRFHGVCGVLAAARRLLVSVVCEVVGVQDGLICIFFLFLDLSVRSWR
jgi:hypothetical protein